MMDKHNVVHLPVSAFRRAGQGPLPGMFEQLLSDQAPHECCLTTLWSHWKQTKSTGECPVSCGFYLARYAEQLRQRGDSSPAGFKNQSKACSEHSRWKVKREIPETREMGGSDILYTNSAQISGQPRTMHA